ncbi:MAG: PilZ domain-containing protein [Gaiellales bacterium]
MTPLFPDEAAGLLFRTREADLEVGRGAFVRVHADLIDGDVVSGTAPRLSVSEGMHLTGRVLGPDGRPWEVGLHVGEARYHTPDLARVRLEVVTVRVDQSRRAAQRVPIGGIAWLEAVNCRDVVDGDRVDGTLEDLSKTGVAFATPRVLRKGDRLTFHGRFFADSISGEVRVMAVRPASVPGLSIVGCQFIDIRPGDADRIERILSGGRGPAPSVDITAIREMAVGDQGQDGGGWKRLFRRGE